MTRRNPPKQNRQPGHHVLEEEAEFLREHEGEPHIIRHYPPEDRNNAAQFRQALKSGRLAAFRPAGAFDAVTATEQDPESGEPVVNVYAWYGELNEELLP